MSGQGGRPDGVGGQNQVATRREADSRDRRSFPVVGIGASAGGIEALETLFRAMPAGSEFAFVVVQHLHPEYESHMSEVLRRDTEMPVVAVEEGIRIEPTWVESGGPEIEPSSDRGFGLTLVERSIAHELDGEANIEFRPGGLFCELLIPHNPDNIRPD